MQAGADHRHLKVKGIQQGIGFRAPQAAAQELAALAQQAPVAAEQLPIDRFQLQHHPIQPLAAPGRFAPHQLQI